MSKTPDAPPDRYTEMAHEWLGAQLLITTRRRDSLAALLRSIASEPDPHVAELMHDAYAARDVAEAEVARLRAEIEGPGGWMDLTGMVQRGEALWQERAEKAEAQLAEARRLMERHIRHYAMICSGECTLQIETRAFLAAQPKADVQPLVEFSHQPDQSGHSVGPISISHAFKPCAVNEHLDLCHVFVGIGYCSAPASAHRQSKAREEE